MHACFTLSFFFHFLLDSQLHLTIFFHVNIMLCISSEHNNKTQLSKSGQQQWYIETEVAQI